MSKFPTKEEFLKLFDLFPKGNPVDGYREVKYAIATKKTFIGKDVTWKLISERYEKYIKKRKKEGFIEKYIKSIESFIKSEDWNIDFDKEPDQENKNSFEKGLDDQITELENRLNKNDKGKREL